MLDAAACVYHRCPVPGLCEMRQPELPLPSPRRWYVWGFLLWNVPTPRTHQDQKCVPVKCVSRANARFQTYGIQCAGFHVYGVGLPRVVVVLFVVLVPRVLVPRVLRAIVCPGWCRHTRVMKGRAAHGGHCGRSVAPRWAWAPAMEWSLSTQHNGHPTGKPLSFEP
jgi:hypothetical protein